MSHNILFFPWRDWNTFIREGFRTREANILKSLHNDKGINNILCVNRPSQPLYVEALLKRNKNYIFKGKSALEEQTEIPSKTLYKRFFSKLIEVETGLYILDLFYHLPNPKGNKLERISVFSEIFKKEVKYALNFLYFKGDYITWAYDVTRSLLIDELKTEVLVFDIIDNLLEHDQIKDKKFYEKQY